MNTDNAETGKRREVAWYCLLKFSSFTSLYKYIFVLLPHRSVLTFIKEYNFNGLDLDYEFPDAADKIPFGKWIKELKEAFIPFDYELTAAISAVDTKIKAGLDVPAISQYLDAIHIMAYDFHGSSWESTTADHHAALYKRSVEDTNFYIDYA